MIFCTLFDSYYLDKGLVMFESLKNITDDFKLYVIAFDDKCYDILKDYNDEKLIPISLKEFEKDRTTALGVMKHWHTFEVIAKKK